MATTTDSDRSRRVSTGDDSAFEYGSGRRARRAARYAAEHYDEDDAREDDGVNVNRVERVASVLGGGALALYGMKRKDLTGVLLGVVAGALVQRGTSGHCSVYGALGVTSADRGEPSGELQHGDDAYPKQQHGRNAVLDASKARRIEHTVTIARQPEELYAYWRNFENLPRIMEHLESVTVIDAKRSHWKAKAPAGTSVEWDAEIVNEIPNQLIAWKSRIGASVPNAGSVHFDEAPGGRGTELRVVMEYEPPVGKLGVALAKLMGEEPEQQVREDLRRFKQNVESGELATSLRTSQQGAG
jgi:uncharacterized membrane protein